MTEIKFKDLSLNLKIGFVGGYLYIALITIGFIKAIILLLWSKKVSANTNGILQQTEVY